MGVGEAVESYECEIKCLRLGLDILLLGKRCKHLVPEYL
jgi:hypothetical protein